MISLLERMRYILSALALCAVVVLVVPIHAQTPAAPVDPDRSVVNEKTLLQEFPRIEGQIVIPNDTAAVLIQPAGRSWQYFHEVLLQWIGVIAILGMIGLLVIFYLLVGPLRISAGRSGIRVFRYTPFERFCHWLNAASFVVLALTGLNITFGKHLLLPVIGPDTFTAVSEATKYVHNFAGFSFVVGFVLVMAIWMKDNIPNKVDLIWLKEGGGFIPSKHPTSGRFNAGEKMVFWLALAAGILVSVTGFFLLFPFYLTNIAGMQIAQVVHSVIAVLFIALILGHIYIGTLGMQGAFEGMETGYVDLNWAKEHHGLWLKEEAAKGHVPDLPPSARPAE
jgi:formate dehydrogenase subunit gamma